MSNAGRRLEVTQELRRLLTRQLELAAEQRRELARLDGAAVLRLLHVREELRGPTDRLIDELGRGEHDAGSRRELQEVRGLARHLIALDEVNREVAVHGLAAVRGLLQALAPRLSAYDRQGREAALAAVGSRSTRA